MNNSIDQQFVEFVVKSLVSNPDAVQIERRIDEKGVLLELTVDPEDLGRVIGKRGATAQSLRTLLRALGTKNDARYNLKIVDNGVGDHRSSATSDDSRQDSSSPSDSANDDMSSSTASDRQAQDESDDNDKNTTVAELQNDELDDDSNSDTVVEDESSDRLSQTRRELAELDDLDV